MAAEAITLPTTAALPVAVEDQALSPYLASPAGGDGIPRPNGEAFDRYLEDFKSGKITLANESPDVPETVTLVPESIPAGADPDLDDDDGPVENGGKQYRIRTADPRDTAVFAIMKANPGWTIAKATESLFGVAVPATVQESGSVATPEAQAPVDVLGTVEGIDARIVALRKEKDEAWEMYEMDRVNKLQDEILDLSVRKVEVGHSQAQAVITQQATDAGKWSEAEARAVTLYPDSGVESSPLYQRAGEILDVMRANQDPLIKDPQVVVRAVQMAAAELGIAPARASGAAPVIHARPAGPVLSRIRPASGGAVAAPPVVSDGMARQAINAMSLDELREHNRHYGRRAS